MQYPCKISELIAIYLSLQNPFYRRLKEVDMKYKEAEIPD